MVHLTMILACHPNDNKKIRKFQIMDAPIKAARIEQNFSYFYSVKELRENF